ncbi:hypothetical protein XM47_16235 [Catenovulum maritimum]|uniref:Solute-binding protein family 3/N-terminal domain-containing protein n=2 Tax=Catenovulum maritimum TaxID=1513271 RepID=A0A0J8GMP0_9ALTE|nr:hypothetical protein XM47_16235 [Catenovulum maritimum]
MINKIFALVLCSNLLMINFSTWAKPEVKLNSPEIILQADEWCPYNCKPNSALPGFMVEIAKAIFEPHGYQVKYQKLNWPRALHNARTGKINGVIGALYSDAPDFIFPENSQGSVVNAIWARKDINLNYKSVEDLKGYTLGAIRNYSYGIELDKYIKSNRHSAAKIQLISGANPLESNLKKLLHNRIDLIIEDNAVLKFSLQNRVIKQQFKHIADIASEPIFIAFSPARPDSKKLAKLLSDGMKNLRLSGELATILHNYSVPDWQ